MKDQIFVTVQQMVYPFDLGISIASALCQIVSDTQQIVAARVNGHVVDLSTLLTENSCIDPIFLDSHEGLCIVRHSTAHLLAHAVQDLFPQAKMVFGPVIENGFYYEFDALPFTPQDIDRITIRMKELILANLPVQGRVCTRQEAHDLFQEKNQPYKIEILKDIPEEQPIFLYQQGDFIDLCRGPHVPYTGCLGAFKLLQSSGSYWRGDAKNQVLQRIYGTAWADERSLDSYLNQRAAAELDDHRHLAQKMDLFHVQAEAPGCIFWHPKGWQLVRTIQDYVRRLTASAGYQEVNTPQMVDHALWEKSGHQAKFDAHMFTASAEDREYIIKPMSCPCHVELFKHTLKSYRDLPVRYSEFGICHRGEFSGTLHGILRVRAFTQDDGHIFCSELHIQKEVQDCIHYTQKLYREFGFQEIIYKLSTRPEKRLGSDTAWDQAEEALKSALSASSVPWILQTGEGAFYGPKIEFSLKDRLDRVWQCGTIQLDFMTAERLGASYIDQDNKKCPPVMIHRAILGSIERFIGILLEHYSGKLPFWLSPVQAVVISVSDRHAATATTLANTLHGFRVQTDLRNEKIGFKIREHTIARIPYIIIIGERELSSGLLSVRTLDGIERTLSQAVLMQEWQKHLEGIS